MRTPTHKPQLPSYLSYPIGFEHVNEALRGVPQGDVLELAFRASAELSATAFRKTVESGLPHLVVSACQPSNNGCRPSVLRRPRWTPKPGH